MCSGTETSTRVAIPYEVAANSKIRQAPLRPQKKRVRWTPDEDATILEMKEEGCSWKDIQDALPNRTLGAIQVRYSTISKGNINGSVRVQSDGINRARTIEDGIIGMGGFSLQH